MRKILFFLMFMVAIGLIAGLYAVIFRQSIDLIGFSIPWQLAGLVYLGGALWLCFMVWEMKSD